MKKRVFATTLFLVLIIILCSCGGKEGDGSLEFPKTKWGMTRAEVLEAYGIEREDTSEWMDSVYGTSFAVEGQKLFGEETGRIRFEFLDIGSGTKQLCVVSVEYPDDADMDRVLKNMRKEYGDTVSEITMYQPMTVIPGILAKEHVAESETMKVWGSAFVNQEIPEEHFADYRTLWSGPFPLDVNEENWGEFYEKSRLAGVLWSDDGGVPGAENALYFNAYNLMVYNQMKGEQALEETDQPENSGDISESYLPDDFFNQQYDNGTDIYVPWLTNACLYSLYDSPEEVDLYELFYGGLQLAVTEEDVRFLEEQGAPTELEVMKLPGEEMDRILQKYFNLTLADTNRVGLEKFYYNEETDTYYLMRSDSNNKYINAVEQRKNQDGDVELIYTLRETPEGEDVSGQRIAVIKEMGGRYVFCSNRELN